MDKLVLIQSLIILLTGSKILGCSRTKRLLDYTDYIKSVYPTCVSTCDQNRPFYDWDGKCNDQCSENRSPCQKSVYVYLSNANRRKGCEFWYHQQKKCFVQAMKQCADLCLDECWGKTSCVCNVSMCFVPVL
ncbi:hypothetical protein CRM22_002023 [Opisthorchis felineus]|uniref:BPTI/Kunitz inhibitor domain-containing protein n=1 Tax=Opisthorchis felineus TaxID=147828 RepID=A0A4S2M818_OPIFE|nr:hypothetical protein CRM22_002023 [Opisthorchis felineus]TGZ72572.1 hypothetical protein CRM22_002023 [Opisthorchis felineus]